MKSLEEYKKSCPKQWEMGIGYRIVMVLFFEDKNKKGLEIDKLKELTELDNNKFKNTLDFLTKTGEVMPNKSLNSYSLGDKLREALSNVYEDL